MNEDLVDRLDNALHDIFRAMNLDRLPVHRENGVFSAKNLSIMEIRILRNIDENEEMTLKDIREAVDLPNSTLTSIIKKFETKGLVQRYINSSDRRSYVLRITEKGHLINQGHRYFDRKIARTFMERIGNDDQVELFVEMVHKATRSQFFSLEEFCEYQKNYLKTAYKEKD
jgi:DNA-binding MarR family transcriptional regulator